jgi:hypothetical protein
MIDSDGIDMTAPTQYVCEVGILGVLGKLRAEIIP